MSVPPPPRLARWLLDALLTPAHESLIGDLEEEYHDYAVHYGRRRAALLFWAQTIRTAPVVRLHELIWQSVMLKNYLRVALRNLRKHLGFSAINIVGLAVSMAVCLLVITLVRDQASYDHFHPRAEHIYRITSEQETPFGTFRMATSSGPLGPALQRELPGLDGVVRMSKMGGHATFGDQTLPLGGLYAEPAFFDLFGFALARGDAATALAEPYSLVLTAEAAAKFFGAANPLGQILHRDGIGDFTVTGVLAPLPTNTHLTFEALASFVTLGARSEGEDPYALDDWSRVSAHYTYLLLGPGAAPAAVAAHANALIRQHHTDTSEPPPTLALQALTEINLGADISNQIGPVMPMESAYFLFVFAAGLMLLALFNYISLTMARSLARAQEIGIRKVVGAYRRQIVAQFVSEAVVVAVLALVLAGGLLVWLMPGFNSLQGFQSDLDLGLITIDPLRDGLLYVLFLAFALGIGLLGGLYPAFRMAGFAPTAVLKGFAAGRRGSSQRLRKALIVVQFTVAIVGIITTTVIHRQLALQLQADYGFDEEQLVNVALQGTSYELVREELRRLPGVEQVAATSALPSAGSKSWTDIQAPGMDAPELIQHYSVDSDFLDQFRLTLLAGRDFSQSFATADDATAGSEPILLTEKALALLGFATPHEAVGQVVSFDNFPEPRTATVIGVVSDVYARGYERGYTPLVLRHRPDRYRYAVVRLHTDDLAGALEALESTWKTLAPTRAFDYAFYDDQLAAEYLFVRDLVRFLGLLAGFVILIACLGLLGMASHTATRRVREVGIRKALGADVRSVTLLLSRDYLVLLALAALVALPLAFLLNQTLLQQFPNRVSLDAWMFAAGVVPTLVLALLAVGSQTVRAALTNPVETLRHE